MKRFWYYLFGIAGITLITLGTSFNSDDSGSAIIGGADGPTAIFVAGKVGPNVPMVLIVLGVALVVAGVFFIRRNR